VIYIGMDIHKNFIQACAMDSKGNVLKEQRIGAEEISEFIKPFNQSSNRINMQLVSCV